MDLPVKHRSKIVIFFPFETILDIDQWPSGRLSGLIKVGCGFNP